MRKLPRGNALYREAERLGVITGGTTYAGQKSEEDIQKRFIEARRVLREENRFIVNMIVAMAALASAAAAILAVALG